MTHSFTAFQVEIMCQILPLKKKACVFDNSDFSSAICKLELSTNTKL